MKPTGQVKRIKNGNWQIRVQSNVSGVRKSKSKNGFKSEKDAKDALKILLKEIEKVSVEPSPVKKTFEQLFDTYLAFIKSSISEQTYKLYERTIRDYLRPKFGKMDVSNLTAYDIEMHYLELQDRLSGETLFRVHNQWKRALKKAKVWKWITDDPMYDVSSPSRKTKALNPKRNWLPKETFTIEELIRFFDACPDASILAQYVFFALTGGRGQEVFGGRWQDIDFDKKIFKVRQVLIEARGLSKFGPPKTPKSRRDIPLPDEVIRLLKKHKSVQNRIRLQMGPLWIDNDLIFPTCYGKPQRLSNLSARVKRICAKAGIKKNITAHSFRHTFATIARQKGEDLKVISEYLGHTSIKITMDIYSHVDIEEKREISDRMGALIAGKF
jgi:integrase